MSDEFNRPDPDEFDQPSSVDPDAGSPAGNLDPTMPDDYGSADHMARPPAPHPDDDVPFHLPKTEDTESIINLPGAGATAAQTDADATEELSQDTVAHARSAADPHEQPTMPMTPGDDTDSDTLPGSGGLDPNPDFRTQQTQNPVDQGHTVPHMNPLQHTLVHVPGEEPVKRKAPPPPHQQPTQPQRYQPQPVNYNDPRAQATQPSAIPQPGYGAPGYAPGPGSYPPQAGQMGQAGQAVLPPRKKRRKILGCSPGCVMVFVGVFATFCGGLTLITLILAATLGAELENRLNAQVAQVDTYENFESTFFFDRDGRQLYESFTEGRRTNVEYANFPQQLIDATIAIEDDTFFTNPGFEVEATTRAFLQYVGAAEGESGGSTITQQLVRNVLFDFEYRAERSVRRKVEEIMLAFLLTNRKSKEEILEMYLNEIYYGNLAYGAEAAAQTFFSKSVGELTLGEAAMLAGLPQAPANLDPLNPDPAVQEAVNNRWRLVLDRMVTEGFITDAQRSDVLREGLTFSRPDVPLNAPHFTVHAQQEFEQLMLDLGYTPDEITRGGLRVYTTVDLEINDLAQQVAASQVAALAGNNVSNAAVLVLKPITGEILAMVGSVDYNNDAIDGRVNVTTAPRQPGSTMKAFTYSAAMERGMTPGHIIWDTPTEIGTGTQLYVPRNYDGTFHGPVRMRTALASSYNVPAIQTLRHWSGVDYLLGMMERFGVRSLGTDAGRYGLSLTLGGGEVTLLELTRAYSVFANQGALVPTTSILCIIDGSEIIYQYENSCPQGTPTDSTSNQGGYGRQVLDPRVAYIITDILADNQARSAAMGSNSPLRTDGIGTAVKTGTTNDVKDNWTVGYTRNVAVGVWVGNSNGDPMVNSSGLTGAAPIWNQVITAIHNDQRMMEEFIVDGQLLPDRPDQPNGLALMPVCNINTLRDPATDCGGSLNEWFLESPAAIPDPEGNLFFPQAEAPTPDAPPANGPWLREVEYDIYRVLVQPLDPNVAASISFNTGSRVAPPAPLYCQVPVELAGSAPGAREQLFLRPPFNQEDAARAEQYARNNNLAFLPSIACSPELLNAAPGGNAPAVLTANITSPQPGQVITDATPILGTVSFAPGQAEYYKLEIIGGQFNTWTTIGETHSNPVVNGQLETLPGPPGLQPGEYQLQLVVVNNGNYVQPPYVVPFRVQ